LSAKKPGLTARNIIKNSSPWFVAHETLLSLSQEMWFVGHEPWQQKIPFHVPRTEAGEGFYKFPKKIDLSLPSPWFVAHETLLSLSQEMWFVRHEP
jgi:hypothetical protein